MLLVLISGCGLPFFLLFSVAISSLLCSFIINNNNNTSSSCGGGVVVDATDVSNSIHKQKVSTTTSRRLKSFQISSTQLLTRIINREQLPSVICQSDEDSDFCNLFNDSYNDDGDNYDRNSHHHHHHYNNNNNIEDECSFLEDIIKPSMSKHYACPPTSLAALRKRYGTRKSIWGEWSPSQTRQFYKSQLPKALESK